MIKISKEKKNLRFYETPKVIFVIRLGLWVLFIIIALYVRSLNKNCPYMLLKEDGTPMTSQEARDIMRMYEILKADPKIDINQSLFPQHQQETGSQQILSVP